MRKLFNRLYTVPADTSAKVFPGLNAAKGTLILLVIFTHCLPDGMLLYFNYFFHMPVFMAISGFLLKRSVFQYGLKSYSERLWHRLMIPWIIACVIYLPVQHGLYSLAQVSFADVLYPYFHLWYIPGYILAALLCFAVTKWKVPAWPILFLTGAITVAWFILYRDNKTPVTQQSLYYMGDKRFYAYLFFFFLGFSLRNGLISVRLSPILLLCTIVGSFSLVAAFAYSALSDYTTVVLYMIFNTSLVLFLLLYVAQQNWMQNKLLLLINRQSLGIYLYHPFIIVCIYQLIGHPNKVDISKLEGIAVGVAVVALVLPFIWLVKKWHITSKLILGNIKK